MTSTCASQVLFLKTYLIAPHPRLLSPFRWLHFQVRFNFNSSPKLRFPRPSSVQPSGSTIPVVPSLKETVYAILHRCSEEVQSIRRKISATRLEDEPLTVRCLRVQSLDVERDTELSAQHLENRMAPKNFKKNSRDCLRESWRRVLEGEQITPRMRRKGRSQTGSQYQCQYRNGF